MSEFMRRVMKEIPPFSAAAKMNEKDVVKTHMFTAKSKVNENLREKLLARYADLKEAIDIAKSVEHRAECIKEMKITTESDTVKVIGNTKNQEEPTINKDEEYKVHDVHKKKSMEIDNEEIKTIRYRCGNGNHLANNPSLPCTIQRV
ncbi:hypothetical protein NDU88_002868 [Pleurodeles waltl]|uniref:Uncharacterized protein n=1 Tax=Pleurodeles waltl TaxID=8319 RepID=A0AAV7MPK1_PLEWA|nr:hypothetical protein NDU88_002868 [Pleurodeles waltl]